MKVRQVVSVRMVIHRFVMLAILGGTAPARLFAGETLGPEATLRVIVEANAARDLDTMSRHMSHDADAVGYTIDGHKYVGWLALEADMRSEFEAVHKLELPITYLQVWEKGDLAWFAMELDYIRYPRNEEMNQRMVLPLRETGVLERRDGQWILVAWHESVRQPDTGLGTRLPHRTTLRHRTAAFHPEASSHVSVSGEWDITEVEDNKRYRAMLDAKGNGPYTWQSGQITTTHYEDRRWQGTWKQPGNDREGAFEVILSEDGTEAKGIWWYTRVGTRDNIPPRQHGGAYLWKRVMPTQ